MYTAIITIVSAGFTIPAIILSYIKFYVIGLSEEESFELPSPMMSVQTNYRLESQKHFRIFNFFRLPFDAQSPFGYFVAASLQAITTFSSNMLFICMLCPLLGSCWMIISFLKDITNDLAHLKIRKLSNENSHAKLKHQFCRVIALHSDVKQLSVN